MKRVISVVQFLVIVILPTVYYNLEISIGTYFTDKMNESIGEFCDLRVLRILMGLISCLFLVIFFILSQYFIKTSLARRVIVLLVLVGHLVLGGICTSVEFLWYYRSGTVILVFMVAIVLTVLGKWNSIGTKKIK